MQHITIPKFSEKTANKVQEKLNSLAKVPGSLGQLEELCIRLAGIMDNEFPSFAKKSVVLFASDHNITLHGLSTAGQEVTEMQVRNFLRGGGTICAFARNANADLHIVDVGVKRDILDEPNLINKKIMHGANDFSKGFAMTREQAIASIQVGIDIARIEAKKGVSLLAAGEMGIGNTSPSSAITSVLTGTSVATVTGMGSGISPEKQREKRELLERGIALNKPNKHDGLDVLAKVGGPELGAMAGLMLGGAECRIPVVVDGFIAGAAAAIAVSLYPEVSQMLIGSHISKEPGHKILMDYINIPTYFDFGLRLGEGTGAVLLFPIIEASTRILKEMSTLEEMRKLYK